MFELGILLVVAFGALWVFGALMGALFKLAFGIVGAVVGGLFGAFALGIAALLVLPILVFALLPMLLPALGVAALVWAVVHASRTHAPPPQVPGDARVG